MKDKDKFWKKAKEEGYRARSSYKLKQINKRFNLIKKDDNVLDIGAAPGGWLQVVKEIVDDDCDVLGVDIRKISSLPRVNTIRGDISEESTLEKIKDFRKEFDVVISDVSPDLSGNWTVDHARSIDLSRKTLDLVEEVLKPGGNYLVKVFQGDMYYDFYKDVEDKFEYVKAHSPEASRDQSAEIYVIGKRFLKKPVEEGERYKVEIVDEGKEGDGIAKIKDLVIFVPEAKVNQKVEIEITSVKENFAEAKIV